MVGCQVHNSCLHLIYWRCHVGFCWKVLYLLLYVSLIFLKMTYCFYLHCTDGDAMIISCSCSTKTSGINETMIDFLTSDYIVNLIIHCHCFCQIFRIKPFVSISVDVKIDEMLPTVIWNTTSITNSTIVTDMLFDLFPILAFQYPVKNTSNLFLSLSRTVLTSL